MKFSARRWALFALCWEFTYTKDFVQFADDARQYLVEDQNAVQSRMAAMESIQAEHQDSNGSPEGDYEFIQTLKAIYALQPGDTLDSLFASVDRVCRQISEYNVELDEITTEYYPLVYIVPCPLLLALSVGCREYCTRGHIPNTIKLRDYIWDGCTKQPSSCDQTLSLLFHSLRKKMEGVESQVHNSVKEFIVAKNKSKSVLHKLWIWLLTNPEKLLTAIMEAKTKCGTLRRHFAS